MDSGEAYVAFHVRHGSRRSEGEEATGVERRGPDDATHRIWRRPESRPLSQQLLSTRQFRRTTLRRHAADHVD